MDYLSHYKALIRKVKSENRQKLSKDHPKYIYYETHHIIPRCLLCHKSEKIINGEWNLVLLTAREHFVAHLLLWKIYKSSFGDNSKRTQKLLNACVKFWNVSGERHKINSHTYQILRNEFSSYRSSVEVSQETKKKLSDKTKERLEKGIHNFQTNHPMKNIKNQNIIRESNLKRARQGTLNFQTNNPMKDLEFAKMQGIKRSIRWKNLTESERAQASSQREAKSKITRIKNGTNKCNLSETAKRELSERMKTNNPSHRRSQEDLSLSAKRKMKSVANKLQKLMELHQLEIYEHTWDQNIKKLKELEIIKGSISWKVYQYYLNFEF